MGITTNLIYNGDFSNGTTAWSGSELNVTDGYATVTGDIINNIFIPVANGKRYRLSFDLKFNTVGSGKNFYVALRTFDAKQAIFYARDASKRANTETTLAAQLTAGDTTAEVADSTGWVTSSSGRIGICDTLAYGYNRYRLSKTLKSIDGNTLTLSSAWTGETLPSGTPVANFQGGSSHYYPRSWGTNDANKPLEWTTYSMEFDGGDSIRYSCRYIRFSTLGYTHNYSIRNVVMECINDYQECPQNIYYTIPKFLKSGVINASSFNEIGMNIRYIRDTMKGSTYNDRSHWDEIQVFNTAGENIAWTKDVKIDNTVFQNSPVTDGIVDKQYININDDGNEKTLFLDLGFVERINCIKIWHYFIDGRTYYNNKTEVSADGKNWYTVYEGQKPETVNGNIIYLSHPAMSIHQDGEIDINEIIEW